MNFLQDARFGIRMLAKTPAFTAVIILVLALGIGANPTIFTLVNAVLFKGLPFARPEEIMIVNCTNPSQGREHLQVSYPDYKDWKAQSKIFKDMAAFQGFSVNLSDNSALPERFQG